MSDPSAVDSPTVAPETRITGAEIASLSKRKRATLVNSLPGFKSLTLVGTVSGEGKTNLSIISSALHLGSDPPLLGMTCRPATVPRHTYENIRETGVYTFNHVHEGIYPRAHQASARYAREVSEFEAVDLEESWLPGVEAPFVREARVKMALRLVETHEVVRNGVIILVGEVTHVIYPPGIEEEDGYLDLAEAGTLAGAGLDGYYRTDRLDRLSYAKVDRPVERLEPGIGDPNHGVSS